MVKLPAKPNEGDPAAPFLTDTAMWSALLDMLAAWRGGEFGLEDPKSKRGLNTNPMGQSEEILLEGRVAQIDLLLDGNLPTDASAQALVRRKPILAIKDPVWHTEIDKVFVVNKTINPTTVVPIAGQRYVTAPITLVKDEDRYAMIDHEDPTKLKTSTSGIFKIVETWDGSPTMALLDTLEQQRLWRFQLIDDVDRDGEFEARLLRLDGITYASNILLTFAGVPEIGICLKAGDSGYCWHAGNKFYAITTAATFMGEPSLQNVWDEFGVVCVNGQLCVEGQKREIRAFTCEEEGDSPGNQPQPEIAFCFDCQLIWECCDFCDYICYCENYAYDETVDTCQPCIGICNWIFEDPGSTGNGKWVPDPGTPNTCTENLPDCDCYTPPPIDPNNYPVHGQKQTTPCELPPPECTGNCYWTYRQGSYSTTSGTKFFNYWEPAGNDCHIYDPNDCGCCLPPTEDEHPFPEVNKTYAIDCREVPACAGTCEYYWDEGLGTWNEIPELNYCCGTDTANCVCGAAPTDPPSGSTPAERDGQRSGPIDCGGDCTGECLFTFRSAVFTTNSGNDITYYFWEYPPSDNCVPQDDSCTCCVWPGFPDPGQFTVGEQYPVDCAPLPECWGECQWLWEADPGRWVRLSGWCCGTNQVDCGCPTPPPASPNATDGYIKWTSCGDGECSGDCQYVYKGPSQLPGDCWEISFDTNADTTTQLGVRPPLGPNAQILWESQSRDDAPTGCIQYNWIIKWCGTQSYDQVFANWWATQDENQDNDGIWFGEAVAVGCTLVDRETREQNKFHCPGETLATLQIIVGHVPDNLVADCVTDPVGGWQLLDDTCVGDATCECEDPPTDLTNFPQNPSDGDTHTVVDGCRLTPQNGGGEEITETYTWSDTSEDGYAIEQASENYIDFNDADQLIGGAQSASERYIASLWASAAAIPQGATITSAKVTLTASNSSAGNLTIRAFLDNSDTASKPISGGSLTTAVANKTAAHSEQTQTYVSSTAYEFDVTAAVQEVVNRAGWATGNALLVLLQTQSTTVDSIRFQDADDLSPPALEIKYTAAAASRLRTKVDAPESHIPGKLSLGAKLKAKVRRRDRKRR